MNIQPAIAPKTSLLRADQIEEMEGEREGMRNKLMNPNIQDKGSVRDQLNKLDHQLESQRPREFLSTEIDGAVKREQELRNQWMEGMLSHEEMRSAPPGSVDAHLAWERKNKPAILEWQNLMRRLNAGSDAREIASIERFRPKKNQMNLDNALVQTKQYFMPPPEAERTATLSDADLQRLREFDPALADKIGLLSNSQRGQIKKVLSQAQIDGKKGVVKREAVKAEKKAKKIVSPEQLAKMAAGRDAARAKKLAAASS